MTPEEYLDQTGKAVQQQFESLKYYQELLSNIEPQMIISDTEITEEVIEVWEQENRDDIERTRVAERAYFGMSFSNQTICGGILQIAARGISVYSAQSNIPTSCSSFINTSHRKVIPFCVGGEVRTLPKGLVIYGGRNQYNHWDEPSLNATNTKIFDVLSREHGFGTHLVDPAFDLTNPALDIYSHNILAILEWRTYQDYIQDMREMICP